MPELPEIDFGIVLILVELGCILLVISIFHRSVRAWKNRSKGRSGEEMVKKAFLRFNQNQYKVLNDMLLASDGRTKTTQIDHVIVSCFGIFCIETKASKGWITGHADDQYWTQNIFGHTNSLYNPLKQNYAHVKAIEGVVKSTYPQVPIRSFVIFTNADRVGVSGTDAVGKLSDIERKIKGFTHPILSEQERDEICVMLKQAHISDRTVRRQHDRDVKSLKK